MSYYGQPQQYAAPYPLHPQASQYPPLPQAAPYPPQGGQIPQYPPQGGQSSLYPPQRSQPLPYPPQMSQSLPVYRPPGKPASPLSSPSPILPPMPGMGDPGSGSRSGAANESGSGSGEEEEEPEEKPAAAPADKKAYHPFVAPTAPSPLAAVGDGAAPPRGDSDSARLDPLAFLRKRTHQQRMIGAFFDNAKQAVARELAYRGMGKGVNDAALSKAMTKELNEFGKNNKVPEWAAEQHMRKVISELEAEREAEKSRPTCANYCRPWRWGRIRRANRRKSHGDIEFRDEDSTVYESSSRESTRDGSMLMHNIFNNILESEKKKKAAEPPSEVVAPGGWVVEEVKQVSAADYWEPVAALRQRDYIFTKDMVKRNKIRSKAMAMPKPGDPLPGRTQLNSREPVSWQQFVRFVFFDSDYVRENYGIIATETVPMPHYKKIK